MLVLVSTLGLLICYATFQSFYVIHGAFFSESATPALQPQGSLLLSPVAQAAAGRLGETYQSLAGTDFGTYEMPDRDE